MSQRKRQRNHEASRTVRETSGRDGLRASPRWPGSGLWTEAERARHRTQRDAIQRDAGLDPAPGIEGSADADPEDRSAGGSDPADDAGA